jgi:hypothetical protein
MTPGDMPDFDPFLQSAADTLSDPKHNLAVKHCIVISDGDPSLGVPGMNALAQMKTNKITCTSVGVATHSPALDERMGKIADSAFPGGKYYNVKNPNDLPEIYMRESRRVSQAFLYEKQFNPKLVSHSGPTDKLDANLPDLHGFVRTTLKTFDQRFPILATWQYGLGRSAAFTSDAKSMPGNPVVGWDRDWANSDIYLKFWEQTIGWAMRGLETDRLVLNTEYRDGKIRVTVEARDENNKPITDLRLTGKVSSPINGEGPPVELKFEQRSGGNYEAEFKADQAGSYIINAQAKQRTAAYRGRFRDGLPMTTVEKDGRLQLADGTPVNKRPDGSLEYADNKQPVVIEQEKERVVDSRRAGVTISYSPEFADLETNAGMLKTLATITGGNVYQEDSKIFREVAQTGELYRLAPEVVRSLLPLWYWLVFIGCVLLLVDVANRRITVEAAEVRMYAQRTWHKLRSRATKTSAQANTDDEFITRLKTKKSATLETLENEKSTRKFEGLAGDSAPTGGADELENKPAPPKFEPKAPPPLPTTSPPEQPADTGDYFSKLRAAKKRAPTDRDGDT